MRALPLAALLAAVGAGVTYKLFPVADSMGKYPAKLSRGEAIERARTLAAGYGRDVDGWPVWVANNRHQRTYEFLRTAPDSPLSRVPHPYSYVVVFTRGPMRVTVELAGSGAPVEYWFRDGRRPDFMAAPLTAEQEKRVLADFAGPVNSPFYRQIGSVSRGARGHATTWEWRDEAAPELIEQLEVTSAPDGIRRVQLRSELGATFVQRWIAALGRGGLRAVVLPVLLVLVISMTNALFFPAFARGHIRLRRVLALFGALMAIRLIGFFAGSGYGKLQISGLGPAPERLLQALAVTAPVLFLFAAMWSVGRWMMRAAGSLERWRTMDALLGGEWWRREVGRSVACGLLLGAALTAIPIGLCAAGLFPRSDAQTVTPDWLAAVSPAAIPLSYQLPWDLSAIFFLFVPLASTPWGRRRFPAWARWTLAAVIGVLGMGLVRSLVNDDAMGNFTTGALLAAGFAAIYWKLDLVAVLMADLGFWATLVAVYFLRQESPALRASGAMTAGIYGSVALAGAAAVLWARQLETKPDEEVVEIATQRETFETEFAMAREAQQRLLPAIPARLDGFSLAASCHPAREVGGDLYDFFRYPDGTYGLCVADVSGKGVPAALYMTMTKGILAAASRDAADLPALALALNAQLHEAGRKKTFVTMALGRLDAERRTLEYLRAGHNSILWRRSAAGKSEYRQPKGVGLGLTGNRLFERAIEMETLALEAGDVVVFYSDGITEAMNAARELYGEERLQAVVESNAGLDAAGLEREILREVREFMAGEPPHDDMTLFVLRA